MQQSVRQWQAATVVGCSCPEMSHCVDDRGAATRSCSKHRQGSCLQVVEEAHHGRVALQSLQQRVAVPVAALQASAAKSALCNSSWTPTAETPCSSRQEVKPATHAPRTDCQPRSEALRRCLGGVGGAGEEAVAEAHLGCQLILRVQVAHRILQLQN